LKGLYQKVGPRLTSIGIAVVVLGGLALWSNWDKLRPYPTWHVTERNDPSGVYLKGFAPAVFRSIPDLGPLACTLKS
jgi:hypothetical protein